MGKDKSTLGRMTPMPAVTDAEADPGLDPESAPSIVSSIRTAVRVDATDSSDEPGSGTHGRRISKSRPPR